jgi:hypothetical protein
MTGRKLAASALLSILATAPIAAQGKSGSPPGKSKKNGAAAAASATVSPATATAATSAPATSANSVLYYGSWLDDASIMTPRTTWVSTSTAYWKADAARQVDAPVFAVARGLSSRAQVGGSLPIFHFRDDTGGSASGLGTVSVYGKVMLIDPSAKNRVGVAIAPLIEMARGADHGFGWALPVNVEARAARFRVYGSAGYFSRGAVFGTAAVEIPTGTRGAITGNFGESRSGSSHQTSLGLSLSFFPSAPTGLFVSLGRATAVQGLDNGGVSLGGGVSFLIPSR